MSAADLGANTMELLERLVGFDTTSHCSNLELIGFVEDLLTQRAIPFLRLPDPTGTKANLIARVGPAVAGGVVVSGHTDVVPVEGQAWTSPPFTLTARGDRLYGRGTADMKSFLALCLAHLDAAQAAPLRRPLILAFSYDEEVGCQGAPDLIAKLDQIAPPAAAVIVGEPTSMQVVSAHKSITTFHVSVTGKEGHSSDPRQGVSAVMAALELMQLVATMAAEAEAQTQPDSLFSPPYPTMTIGQVQGGTAVNILAGQCQFLWDLRCPPDIDPAQFEQRFTAAATALDQRLKARAPEAGVRVTRRSSTPGLAVAADSPAEVLARALTGDNALRAAGYAAEAGLFQRAGIPTVLCGPGDIAQAHQPDEWIARDQIDRGAVFLAGLISNLSA